LEFGLYGGQGKQLHEVHGKYFNHIFSIYQKIQRVEMNKIIIDLLKYKKQLILQGPPGTGKTRLAEIIAKELTKPVLTDSPIDKINDFFRTFNAQDEQVLNRASVNNQLFQEFHQKFPMSSLATLTLDQYAIGTGSNDSFCWWIERGLKPLGYYFPGSAKSYRIYWSKEHDGYLKNGAAFRELSDEDAMEKIASILSDFILSKNFDAARGYFGDSFLLKLLNTYYPDEFAPINSPIYLDNCLKLFGIDGSGLNLMQKNQKVQDYYFQKKKEFNSEASNLEFMRFLVNNFDIAGTITFEQSRVVSKGEYKLVQFHPAYSYEDFVRGIVAGINQNGQIEYSVVNKIIGSFASRAAENRSANYVLIIDEINRANLPTVLGELIYALEYRDNAIESLYELKDLGNSIALPSNLFIIGTMNTADRSVGHIDYAIRRRFAFVDLLPSREPLADISIPYFKMVSNLFIKNYDHINWSNPILESAETLAPDFRPHDVWLGHSYFIVPEEKEGKKYSEEDRKNILYRKMAYEVAPLLEEYVKDGVLTDCDEVKKVIYELSQNK
jgi:5-methylcytosine-specific restriction protein B